MKIQILFQDRYLLIVSKPYGMPVYSDISPEKSVKPQSENTVTLPNGVKVDLNRKISQNGRDQNSKKQGELRLDHKDATRSAVDELQKKMNCKLHPVHRLDSGTAGVLLFGRDPKTASLLIRDFGQRKISKTYLAIVSGRISKSSGLMVDEIKKKNEAFKRAETAYKVLATTDHFSLLLLQPKTGRFHQIRKQCKILGHPILGDSTYSGKNTEKNPEKMTNDQPKSPDESRMFLFALELELIHPVLRKPLRIRAPLDSLFQKKIRQLFGPDIRV